MRWYWMTSILHNKQCIAFSSQDPSNATFRRPSRISFENRKTLDSSLGINFTNCSDVSIVNFTVKFKIVEFKQVDVSPSQCEHIIVRNVPST